MDSTKLFTTRKQKTTSPNSGIRTRLNSRSTAKKWKNWKTLRRRIPKILKTPIETRANSSTNVWTTPRSSARCGWWFPLSHAIGLCITLEGRLWKITSFWIQWRTLRRGSSILGRLRGIQAWVPLCRITSRSWKIVIFTRRIYRLNKWL